MPRSEELKKVLESTLREGDDPRLSEAARVQRVIFLTAAVCAGIAIQPLPFADMLVYTPVQAFMAMIIGNIKGFPVSKKQAEDIIKELGGMVGLGLLAHHGIASLAKLGLPAAGGLIAAPLVFASTYAMGAIAEYYFDQKRAGRPVFVDEVKKVWASALGEGRRRAESFLGKEQATGAATTRMSHVGSTQTASYVAPRSTVVLYPGQRYSEGYSPVNGQCPGCGQVYEVPQKLMGHDVRCSRCRTTFQMAPPASQ